MAVKEKAMKTESVKLVLMVRSAEDAKGGPETADVHPSEVENWKAAGWKLK